MHPDDEVLVRVGVSLLTLGQVIVDVVVFLGRRGSPPRLQQAHDELGVIDPEAALRRCLLQIVGEGRVRRLERRRRVPGKHVVQRAEVRRALDVRVAAERHHAAAGTPDVPEDELQHAERADLLDTVGGLVELQRVRDRARLVRPRRRAVDVGHLQEQVLRDAADPLHHLRGVARVVAAQVLEHAVSIAERWVLFGIPVRVELELPRGLVVTALAGVVAAEQPVEVRRGLEARVHQQGRVGERDDVVVEVLLALDGVADQPAEEDDVRARADRHVVVRGRGRPREPGVHVDDLRAALLGLHHPFVADRVAFGPVRGRHDHVGVLHVDQIGGHRAAAEGRAERGHRGGVAEARRVLEVDEPHAARELGDQVVLLVVQHGRAQPRHAFAAVHRDRLVTDLDRLDEGLVAGLLHPLRDLLHHPVERLLLPFVAPRGAVHALGDAPLVQRQLVGGRPFRTQRALGVGRVGVALDVDDLVVLDVDELGAPDRAVRTDARERLGLLDPERGGGGLDGGQIDPTTDHRGARGCTVLEEVASRETHCDTPLRERG